jgi:hypothetical protein
MSAGKVALNYLILRLIFCILSPTLMIFFLAVTSTLQGAGKNYVEPLSYETRQKLIDKYCEKHGCNKLEREDYRRYGETYNSPHRKNGRATP